MESNGTDPNQSESPPGNNPQIVTATGGSHVTGVIQGNSVIGNILVTGDHNQIFTGPYERLRDVYLKPKSVFERVRVDRFFGRDWLIEKIDAFLEGYESGYFVLEGKAGLGKTAFLAHLVQRLNAIHHFVELAPGADGIAPSLKSLAAQLIIAWKLLPQGADEVVPGTATRPEFLQNLLFEAAQQRDETKPDEKIIVIVDALDEAGVPAGQNVLGLPKILPQGVYFIVSQRPVEIALTTSAHRVVFTLEPDDQQNLDDMSGFLQQAATWERVRKAIEGSNYTAADFVTTLLAKCQGVWIYLKYVVNEIERGERFPLVLDTLPQGVWQFYAQYWQRWRKEEDWDGVLLPLFSGLAAVQEDLSLRLLCTLTGVNESSHIRRLLDETHRPFLVVTEGEEQRYRLYHASLREFLDGRADLTELTEQEKTFTRELANATRAAHGRISDSYLNTWGGIKNNLARLQDGADGSLPQDYGLKHLAAHLEKADRATELHQLLRLERVHEEQIEITRQGWRGLLDRILRRRPTVTRRSFENIWYGALESASDVSGYLSDVARAWRLARTSQLNPVSLPVRYALITASINSLAQNITPQLLEQLVKNNKLTPTHAWSYARQTPEQHQKAEALILLLPHLPPAMKDEGMRTAFTTVQAIGREDQLTELLEKLVPELSVELREQAARHKWRDWAGGNLKLLEILAPHLSKPLLGELLEEARKEEPWVRDRSFATLLPYCAEPLRTEIAQETYLKLSANEGFMEGRSYHSTSEAMLLQSLVPYLPEPLKTQAFDFIFAQAGSMESLFSDVRLADLPGKLVPHVPEAMKATVVPRILNKIKAQNPRYLLTALPSLAPHVTDPLQKADLLQQFSSALNAIEEKEQDYFVRTMVPQLAKSGFDKEALAFITALEPDYLKMDVLAAIAPFLSAETLRQGLELPNAVVERWAKQKAISALLVRQAQLGDTERALAATEALTYNEWKLRTFTGIVPYLTESRRDSVLQQAVSIARLTRDDYGDEDNVTASVVAALADLGAHQEAIDLARSIDPVWMQATAFAHLLPRLPEEMRASVLKEALEKILDRDAYKQALLLSGLVPILPADVAARTVRQVLAATESIEHETLKMEALVALLPHAPDELRERVFQKVITSSELVLDDTRKAEALTTLARYLSPRELEKAWALARNVRGSIQQRKLYRGLARYLPLPLIQAALDESRTRNFEYEIWDGVTLLLPRLAEAGHVNEALTFARNIKKTHVGELALASLAQHLPAAELQELTEKAKSFSDKTSRACVLLFTIPFASEAGKSELINAAIEAAHDSYDYELSAQTYAELLPSVPAHAMAQTLRRIVDSSQKHYREGRVAIYTAIVPHLLQLSVSERQSTWNEILQLLASKSRGDLFSDLAVFMPVIGNLGGKEELLGTYHAIQDAVHWWG